MKYHIETAGKKYCVEAETIEAANLSSHPEESSRTGKEKSPMTLCTRCKKHPKMHVLSPYCRLCRTEVDLENKERWIAKAKEQAKRQNEDCGALRRALDSLCSSYVIARDKECVTCGRRDRLTNSHYFRKGGGRDSVRWTEANLWCQCAECNRRHSEYKPNDPLQKVFLTRYNEIQLAQLSLKSREIARFREPDLQMMLGNWERKYAAILKATGQTDSEIQSKKYHPEV